MLSAKTSQAPDAVFTHPRKIPPDEMSRLAIITLLFEIDPPDGFTRYASQEYPPASSSGLHHAAALEESAACEMVTREPAVMAALSPVAVATTVATVDILMLYQG